MFFFRIMEFAEFLKCLIFLSYIFEFLTIFFDNEYVS